MANEIIGIVEHIIRNSETGEEQAVVRLLPPSSLVYGLLPIKEI